MAELIFDFPRQSETIIRAFEGATGLSVCFHDLSGRLFGYIDPVRIGHETPHCAAIKARHMPVCNACETTFLQRAFLREPHGLVKVCHAGLVDWSVPSWRGEKVEWVVFAGQRTPGKNLRCALRQPGLVTPPSWPRAQHPVAVEEAEALRHLELLRMLAARLNAWRGELDRTQPPVPGARPSTAPIDVTTREYLVRSFVTARHKEDVRLEDLATHLHLSPSRASHAVRECCGRTFKKLLTEQRLLTAAGLLRHSNLSVLEVATRSGYRDLSSFHEAFKKAHRRSPLAYRKQGKTGPPV